MRTPDFIGIGIIHAGTGWLWRELGKHPEIMLPVRKELNFFIRDRPIRRYYKYFSGIPKHKITGELSVRYFRNGGAFNRIKAVALPGVKYFCVIRNPVDTAFSYYKGQRHKGAIPKATFLQIMRKGYPNVHVDKFKIADRLRKWHDHFGLKFFLYDDLKNDPVKYIQGVYSWLGVDSSFVSGTVNQWSYRPYYDQFGDRKVGKVARKYLVTAYLEETEKMEKLTGFDLSSWRSVEK